VGAVVLDVSVSLDGFATGPDARPGVPLGDGGVRLHEWMFADSGQRARREGAADIDQAVVAELFATTGAVVMGRRMFDLGVAEWGGTPFPVPCFVVTHHGREDLVTDNGTFHFFTDGAASALARARAAAGDKNVLVHSPNIARQLLRAGLVDEIHLHLVPILLGGGGRLFDGTEMAGLRFEPVALKQSARVAHLRYRVRPGPSAEGAD
jgi:dihydrofolate reductase